MFTFHWYGFMYVLGFWIAWWILPFIARHRGVALSRQEWTEVVAWVAAGVIVGGRLGYVLLYEPLYYIHHFREVLLLGDGGMSSHGGFIGVGVVLWWMSKKFHMPFLRLVDIATIPAALGLALGRVGNFINSELYYGDFALLAVAKNILIACVCWYLLVRMKHWADGRVVSVFLMLYAVLRFCTEYFRIQDWGYVWGLSWGQLFTIPLFILGFFLWFFSSRRTV